MKNKKSLILKIIFIILAIGFIAGGVFLIIRGAKFLGESKPDGGFDDFFDFAAANSLSTRYLAFGVVLIFAGLSVAFYLLIVSLIKRSKNAARNSGVIASKEIRNIQEGLEEEALFCEYCGMKLEKGISKCPRCGAVIKKE